MVDLAEMRRLMRKVPRKLRAIDKAIEQATNVSPKLSGMPSAKGGVNSQVEEGTIAIIAAKQAYSELIAELDRMSAELEPYIDAIEDMDIRVVMRLRYVRRMSVYDKDFTDTACMCERNAYFKLGKGEEIVARMMRE